MTQFVNYVQNTSASDSVYICTSSSDAGNCENWIINGPSFGVSPCWSTSALLNFYTLVSTGKMIRDYPSPDGSSVCSALWTNALGFNKPNDVISIRPSDNVIASRTLWDGTNYVLEKNYCNSDNAVTNSTGNIDILVTNESSTDSAKFCALVNSTCDNLKFSTACPSQNSLLSPVDNGLQTVQVSPSDTVCVALWLGDSSSDASPTHTQPVTIDTTLAAVNIIWDSGIKSVTNYYTCPGDGNGPSSPSTPIPSGSLSSISVSPNSVNSNGSDSATISMVILSTDGKTMSNIPINLTTTVGTINPSTVTTTTGGITATSITSTSAGTATITAIIDPSGYNVQINTQPIVEFVTSGGGPAAPSPTSSNLSVSPSSVPADGSTKSTVTVKVIDTNGNPMSNENVFISGTNDVLIDDQSLITTTDGTASTSVTSSTAVTSIVSAVIDPQGSNIPIVQTQTITFTSTNGNANGDANGDTRSFWQKWWWLIVIIIVVIITVIVIIIFVSRHGKSKNKKSKDQDKK